MNVKKLFSCKCGKSSALEVISELNMEDVTVSASCPSCGMAMHITMSAMMGNSSATTSPSTNENTSPSESQSADESDIDHAEYASVGDENVEAAVKNLFG